MRLAGVGQWTREAGRDVHLGHVDHVRCEARFVPQGARSLARCRRPVEAVVSVDGVPIALCQKCASRHAHR